MRRFSCVFFLTALLFVGWAETCLYFSAFNVRILGKTKMGKPEVVRSLVKILRRYDLAIVQEIRDKDEEAFPELFDEIVQDNPVFEDKLSWFTSPRLGRSSSKEQYGFIYRSDRVTLLDHTTYPDDAHRDKFEREPEVARFRMNGCGGQGFEFLVITCHVKPTDARNEMDELVKVYHWAVNHYNQPNAVIAGDFNAGGSYMSATARRNSELLNDPNVPPTFNCLTDDGYDTTVASNDYPYDRIVVAGSRMNSSVSSDHTRVFRFDEDLGLNYSAAWDVSDHYPVETRICCPP